METAVSPMRLSQIDQQLLVASPPLSTGKLCPLSIGLIFQVVALVQDAGCFPGPSTYCQIGSRLSGGKLRGIVGGDGGHIADSPVVDHALVVREADARVVKEVNVTIYHILWELVHVFLEQPLVLEPEPAR